MTRFFRFFRNAFIVLTCCGLLLIILAGTLLRGSLPQYEGKAHLSSLSAPATVERDTLGSVTIRGQNRQDLASTLGFVHAQERFFEMDLMRRQAAGELAEIFGDSAVPLDLEARKYRMRSRAQQILRQLPDDQQHLLTAYRSGVNAGLDALSMRPYPYLLTRTTPVKWREEDSLLVIFSMFVTLNEFNSRRELGLSFMQAELPDALYQFLTASGGSLDAPLIGEALEWPPMPTPDDLDLRKKNTPLPVRTFIYDESLPGSNNFAVSGTLTDGAALVANDMHLTLRVPNLWFRTRLIETEDNDKDKNHAATRIDVSGVSLPGVPLNVLGSNRHIAWSFTNSYGDFIDWVRVKLDPKDTSVYLGSSGWHTVQTFDEIITVRGAAARKITVRETEWGPIITQDYDGVPLAMAWTAFQPGGLNLNLVELEQAQTAEEAAAIAKQTGIPAQNFIVGDKNGHIHWTIAGRIPVRSGDFDSKLPSDWTAPDTGWQGWLEPVDYPHIRNPESGRLWTANTRTVDPETLKILGDGGYDLGARSRQIRDNLFAREQFTVDDLYQIQLDHRALFFVRWHDLLTSSLEHAESTTTFHQMASVLKNWDGRAAVDSVAYKIIRSFRHEVINTLLNAFTAEIKLRHPAFELPRLSQVEHAIWQLIEERPMHLLPANYENWDALIQQCIQQVIAKLQKQSGDITTRTWGEVNAANIRHPLSQHLPAWIANQLNMPPDPLPGDFHMPRIQTPDFGASQRSVVAPGKEEEGYFDMPGGQSGHPLSPYYGSGHTHWISENPTPFLPGKAEQTLYLIP
ncbi:penicillin acylase family protein [Nitrosomonas aestuarii]|uniref:penicillin acylase family protein n=1 Tax=Nitrosomonas aestuarii TaxID=52441 RepID=UPI000D325152|nr:penicillin acylase family protein [Nitrosomonas aestuarii]PTN10725.1 penicillin amidase [Nitrosomonas aestuarii]